MSSSENKSKNREWNECKESSEWTLVFLILTICFSGWGNFENPRIEELEKKVARLEGQMLMIGGKIL